MLLPSLLKEYHKTKKVISKHNSLLLSSRSSFTFTARSVTKRRNDKRIPHRRKFLYCCQTSCSSSDLFAFHRAGCSQALPTSFSSSYSYGVSRRRQETQLLCRHAHARHFGQEFQFTDTFRPKKHDF
jgi:hypothetical protein